MGALAVQAAVRLSEVLAALAYALDLTEGQSPGHAARVCLVSLRLADRIALPADARVDVCYAALLKDAGCSSNAARVCAMFGGDDHPTKEALKRVDWARLDQAALYALRHAAPGAPTAARVWRILAIALAGTGGARELFAGRCERGGQIVADLGFPPGAAAAVRALDEHWDGHGYPLGLRGEQIPLPARIVGLAQTVDVFRCAAGVTAALEIVARRRGRWFDPVLADEVLRWRDDSAFWEEMDAPDLPRRVADLEMPDRAMEADAASLDRLATAFAGIIDAKSPYTYAHSEGVTDAALAVGRRLGLAPEALASLRRAALLHDIGKLGVSNRILDKPGPLDDEEMAAVRRHPGETEAILVRVAGLTQIAGVAAAHHERLDGTGYPRGIGAEALDLPARILAVADVYDALTADRPYRPAMPRERALGILRREAGRSLDADAVAAVAAADLPARRASD